MEKSLQFEEMDRLIPDLRYHHNLVSRLFGKSKRTIETLGELKIALKTKESVRPPY